MTAIDVLGVAFLVAAFSAGSIISGQVMALADEVTRLIRGR